MPDPKDIATVRLSVSDSKSGTKALDRILQENQDLSTELLLANRKISNFHDAADFIGRWAMDYIERKEQLEQVLAKLGVIVNEGASM